MIKGIIFDLFGTIVNNRRLFRPVCEKMASDSSVELADLEEDFVKLYRKHFKDYHKAKFYPEKFYYYQVLGELISKYSLPGSVETYCDYMYASFGKLPAYSDAKALKKLYKHYTLAIVTNADNSFVEQVIESNAILHHVLLTSESAKAYKPSREIFTKALALMGLSSEEVVFVGDSLHVDMVGAAGAGIKGILIDRSRSYLDYVPRIVSLEEIPQLIEQLERPS